MSAPLRTAARIANAGLVVFGLAFLLILGTGGTRLHLGPLGISMRHLVNPLQGLAVFAALRLLIGSRSRGLESRVVAFYARQGLAPRDAPARLASATRAGAILGLGWGTVCVIGDLVHFAMTSGSRGLTAREIVPLSAAGLGLGALGGMLVGAALGALTFSAGRLIAGRAPGRYRAGRWCLAALWVVSPLLLRFAPAELDLQDRRPAVLLAVTAAVLLAAAAVYLVIPAAILRARRGRWGLTVAAGGSLALALAVGAISAFGPAARPGPPRDSHHPNVLLVSIPGLRVDMIGAYRERYSLTPNVDALAADGAMFLDAVTPTTEALPAAASMLTGLYPTSHGIRRVGPGWSWPAGAITEMLAGHGYRTGAFVSAAPFDGRSSRLEFLFDRYDDLNGFRERLARMTVAGVALRGLHESASDRRVAERTAGAFEAWLGGLPPGPWFAWVQLSDPLRPDPRPEPALPSVSAAILGASRQLDRPLAVAPAWAGSQEASLPLVRWLGGYDDAVRRSDEAVGALRRLLIRRGEASRTIVVVLAERGASIGEGGTWFDAGSGLAESVLHVPWIVAGPGVAAEQVVGGPTSLVDVTPTLLGLAGLAGRFYEGEDLSRFLSGGAGGVRSSQSGPVFVESAPHPRYDGRRLHAVRLGPWKLVRTPTGQEELYFVAGGVEAEVTIVRGRAQRQLQEMSDILTARLARQERLFGGAD